MQVAGRLADFLLGGGRRSTTAGLASIVSLAAALIGLSLANRSLPLLLISIGLYGMANGVMTIVRSVSVVELFGREHYAVVSGALAAPGTIGRAAGPWIA